MEVTGSALVTGASRGIGRAVALELARKGFHVVASMRNPTDGETLPGEVPAGTGTLEVLALDVTRPDPRIFPENLRVLVNNAGLDGENFALENTPLEQWRALFETNVFGLAEVTRLALPRLRSHPGSVVCNVTSCSTLLPVPFFGVYRASKAAVSALGESLRAELAPHGVRVLEVMPGAIATDMLARSAAVPEAVQYAAYREQAELLATTRAAAAALPTPAAEAARTIVESILDDSAPLRVGCDPMGVGLLAAWRSQSDEELMAPMLATFGAKGT
ncbi:MAG: SDR family NAD(P)-dependent oxidoreductase [Myxococcota bacterium]